MQISSVAAPLFLAMATGTLWVGGQALVEARDLSATYWLVAGAVSVRASLMFSEKRRS
jgi:hypothetical protein